MSKKTFRRHRRLYFGPSSLQWIKKRPPKVVPDAEVECMLEAIELDVSPTESGDESETESTPPPPTVSFEPQSDPHELDMEDGM